MTSPYLQPLVRKSITTAVGLLYSLSPPVLAMTGKAVPGYEWKLEALVELCLDKDGGTLVTLVRVLFINGCMMLLWVLAAFKHDRQQRTKLM